MHRCGCPRRRGSAAALHRGGGEEYSRRLLVTKRFSDKTPAREVILAWRKGYPRVQAIEALRRAVHSCPMRGARMLTGK